MSRVVITGIGTATPAGLTNQDFWSALTEKRSCIDVVSLFDVSHFGCRLAAELKNLDGNTFPGRKSRGRSAAALHLPSPLQLRLWRMLDSTSRQASIRTLA